MITEEGLQDIILSQKLGITYPYVKRDLNIQTRSNRAIIISGIRRCGKSTLLNNSVDKKASLFINFEDPRLEGFSVRDFYKLEKIAEESGKTQFVFDEIQNIPEWEKYVRTATDQGLTIYISGSNASMLSKELGTKLTGRYQQLELFPFNYHEFIEFNKYPPSANSFEKYLHDGGFPEYLIRHEPDYLRTLMSDIILRDIVVRRNIRNEKTLMKLAVFLMTNSGKEFSYRRLSQLLEIKSVRTTIDYIDFLTDSYLFNLVQLYSPSIRKQIVNPKKIYAIDTGMAKANSLSMSADQGRMLETSVYNFLRQTNKQIYYFKSDRAECDFITQSHSGEYAAIQVCFHLNESNLAREHKGLTTALNNTPAKKGLILTMSQEDNLDGISVIPVWKWMMGI